MGSAPLVALAVVTLSGGCHGSPSTPSETKAVSDTPKPSAPPSGGRSGAILFCAYGSQGVVPAGAKPEDFYRVIVLFEVTTPPGTPAEDLPVTSLVLESAAGEPLARLRALLRAEAAARVPLTTAWQSALDNHGPPFDGRYAGGVVRVRVEAWLDGRPAALPARVRVVLGGPTAPAVVELSGAVAGEWPTG